MAEEAAKTISCHQCKTNECLQHYPQGVPDYCQAKKFQEVVEASKGQYFEDQVAKIHLATAKVLKEGGSDWSRMDHFVRNSQHEISTARTFGCSGQNKMESTVPLR